MPIWLEHMESHDADGLTQSLRSHEFRNATGERMMFLRFTSQRGEALADRMTLLTGMIEAELSARR